MDAMNVHEHSTEKVEQQTMTQAIGPGETEDTADDVLAEIRSNEKAEHATVLDELEKEYARLGEPTIGKLARLELKSVERDPALQMRAQLDEAAIDDYESKYNRERKGLKGLNREERLFPLVEVFELSPGKYTVANGSHRLEAMMRAEIGTWLFSVHVGDIRVAAEYAARANRSNVAVRVTNADKRQMVVALWAIFPNLASRRIGEMAGVDHHTAERHRPKGAENQPREGKGGRKFNPRKSTATATNGSKKKKEPSEAKARGALLTSVTVAPTTEAVANDTTDAAIATMASAPIGEIPQETDSVSVANDVLSRKDGAFSAPVPPREVSSLQRAPTTESLIIMSASVGSGATWQQVAIEGYQLTVRVVAVEDGIATLHFLDGGPGAVAAIG